ncbi:MAG: hypothetical protein CTY16_17050 [Methylobacter sp.]|nr:MAG: hypothetical protein CTY16_17050 [Methylobacter sp.]
MLKFGRQACHNLIQKQFFVPSVLFVDISCILRSITKQKLIPKKPKTVKIPGFETHPVIKQQLGSTHANKI